MKCKNCGADLSIENNFCPFCGTENQEFVQHREDMESFKGKFHKTQEDVYTSTKRFTKFSIKIAMIAVLVACNLIFIVMNVRIYDVEYFFERLSVTSSEDKHNEVLGQLEDSQLFYQINGYYYANDLYNLPYTNEYTRVCNASYSYARLYENVMNIALGNIDSYTSESYYVEAIAESLDNIYTIKGEERYYEEANMEEHNESIEKMLEESLLLLHTYLHISEEELATFEEMTPASRQSCIEVAVLLLEEVAN